jgi:hypothetical protein
MFYELKGATREGSSRAFSFFNFLYTPLNVFEMWNPRPWRINQAYSVRAYTSNWLSSLQTIYDILYSEGFWGYVESV